MLSGEGWFPGGDGGGRDKAGHNKVVRITITLLIFLIPGCAEVTTITITSGVNLGKLPELIIERDNLFEKHARALGLPGLSAKWVLPSGSSQARLLAGQLSFDRGPFFSLIPAWQSTRGTSNPILGVTGVSSTVGPDLASSVEVVWTSARFAAQNPRVVQAVFDTYADVVRTINEDKPAAAALYGAWSKFPPAREQMLADLTQTIGRTSLRLEFTQTPHGMLFYTRLLSRKDPTIVVPDDWKQMFLPIAWSLNGD